MMHATTGRRKSGGDISKRRGILARCFRELRSEEGATLVEFGLSAAIMFALLFGVLQTCLAVYSYDFTSEMARDGARYMIVRGAKCTGGTAFGCGASNSDVQAHLRAESYPVINTNNLTTHTYWYTAAAAPPNMTWNTLCATDTYSAACGVQGNAVKVVVTYVFTWNMPYVKPFTINMTNSSMMVISQ
jgi:Flp pilus assembly protein TadG